MIQRWNQKLYVFLALLDFPMNSEIQNFKNPPAPMHSPCKCWTSSWGASPFCPTNYPLVQFIIVAFWPFTGHSWEESIYLFSQSLSRLWKSEVSFSHAWDFSRPNQPPLRMPFAPAPDHTSGPSSAGLSPFCPYSSCTG